MMSGAVNNVNYYLSFILTARIYATSPSVGSIINFSDSKMRATAKITFSLYHASAERREILHADVEKEIKLPSSESTKTGF